MADLHPPLIAAKNGHEYQIIAVCRVSDPGPDKQDLKSLDDQADSYREWLKRSVDGTYNMEVIAGSGSGELLDREEYQRLIELVATGQFDLVLCEDLGRIVRRVHAHLICEHCEDHDTRLYAINDHVDTAQPGWREASIFAAFHHERSNRDTSERIKRTHRSRFMGGGCLRQPAYGWIKPPGAKTDAMMVKDSAAEPIYAKWFHMLDVEKASFAEVARWLKGQGVKFPTRKRGISATPNGKSVARHTFNPMLKGLRERNRRKTRRINNPGKYVSVAAEARDLLHRRVPHIAFFEESYYDRVVADVKSRNGRCRRSGDPRWDLCRQRPRRQTRYPGQLATCGICGRRYVWGGHGQTQHMMCNGARDHLCWNGVTFDGSIAAEKIAQAVHAEIEKLEGFDSTFLNFVQEEACHLDADRQHHIADLRQQNAAAEQGVANLVRFVRGGDESPAIRDELKLAERAHRRIAAALATAEKEPTHEVKIPDLQQLKQLGRNCLKDLQVESEEFARIMRRLVPIIQVLPVRLCDGGRVVLRARAILRMSELIEDNRARDVLHRPLERVLMIDLFDPPQRALFRERVVAGRSAGKSEREVAVELGLTVTATQRAMALQRMLDELGIAEPYVAVVEPPTDCPKLRRHLHPDYHFDPLMTDGVE
jgi:DNA invertase Pin-like site-specific DNA recombinase